jgi:hypothetical protein
MIHVCVLQAHHFHMRGLDSIIWAHLVDISQIQPCLICCWALSVGMYLASFRLYGLYVHSALYSCAYKIEWALWSLSRWSLYSNTQHEPARGAPYILYMKARMKEWKIYIDWDRWIKSGYRPIIEIHADLKKSVFFQSEYIYFSFVKYIYTSQTRIRMME